MKRLTMAFVSVVVCGCSAVYTSRPIGDRPLNIADNKEAWEGAWLHSDGAITVKVVDGSNGVLRVGWVEKEEEGLKYESADVYLREHGKWKFASMRPAGEAETNRYLWARIGGRGSQMLLWPPDPGKFRRLVLNGSLPGSTNGSNVVLGPLGSNHLDLIASETNGVLFVWDEPLVLFKLSK